MYAHSRDLELRAHPWSFAKKRVILAKATTSPAFGFASAFPLPADYLRIHWDDSDVAFSGGVVPKDWVVENHEDALAIVTDEDSKIELVYVAQIINPNQMDVLFREALASRIAMVTAEKITQSNSKRQLAELDYKSAIAEARRTNAIESPPRESDEDTWLIRMR